MDRPVDVRLGREIDDGARAVLREKRRDLRALADIAPDEEMPRVAAQRRQASDVPGIGELVEVDERLARFLEPVEDEIGADETRASGDENHR